MRTEFDNQVIVSGGGWEQFRRVMLQAKQIANVASDNVVANVGAEGRRAATKIEDNPKKFFNLGELQMKRGKIGIFSRYDEKLGGYRGTKGRQLRMIGFSWENTRSNKNARSFSRSLSSAYAYSLLANLFENPTKPYSRPSPYFMRAGEKKVGIWGKGSVRPGKNYQNQLKAAYAEAIPKAVARTEEKIQRMINSDIQ